MQRESMVIQTLWRDGLSRPCHSEKEIEAATADGFGPYNPKDHEYPRFMYSGTLSAKVMSAAEEKELAKEGWTRTPSADFAPSNGPAAGETAAPKPVENPGVMSLLANHDAAIAGLLARVSALEAGNKKIPRKATDTEPTI